VVGEGMDAEELGPRIVEVRAAELAAALEILGVDEHAFLGYADSGLMGTPGNDDPESFWRADLHEAIGRLVAIIRRFRPAVLTTYDAFGGYGHPDHIQTHRVGLLAAEAAGMAALYPDAGPAWWVPKVYLGTMSKERIVAANTELGRRGLRSPFGDVDDPELVAMGTREEHITTRVDVRPWIDRKRRALAAHASQVGPDSLFLNVPDDLVEAMFGLESYVRVRSDVAVPPDEDDLFAGL